MTCKFIQAVHQIGVTVTRRTGTVRAITTHFFYEVPPVRLLAKIRETEGGVGSECPPRLPVERGAGPLGLGCQTIVFADITNADLSRCENYT